MSYATLGYHIEPDMLDASMCQALRMHALSMSDDSFSPLVMPQRKSDVFLAILRYPEIVAMAEHFINGPASGLATEYFFGSPGTKGFLPHQDNMWVQAPVGAFLHAWTALQDVDASNGCMIFWPGSHRSGLYETEEAGEEAGHGQNVAARKSRISIPDEFKPMDVVMKRGSTVFFDSHLIHASHDNGSDGFRHSVLCTYILKGAPFNPGRKQQRVEIEL